MPYGYGNGGGGPTREMVDRARAHARPRRRAAADARHQRRVLRPRRGRGRRRCTGAGVARRAVLRDAPRHADQPDRRRSSATAVRAPAARGRAVVGDAAARCRPRWPTSWTRCGRTCCCSSSTTSCPGSSIAWVHADAEAAHDRVAARLEAARSPQAFDASALAGADRRQRRHARTRREVVTVAGPVPSDGRGAAAVVRPMGVRGRGRRLGSGAAGRGSTRPITSSPPSTRWPTVGCACSGTSTARSSRSSTCSAAASCCPTVAPITVELAPDHPVEYDAWDLEAWTRALGSPIGASAESTVEFVEHGPLLCSLRVRAPVRSLDASS